MRKRGRKNTAKKKEARLGRGRGMERAVVRKKRSGAVLRQPADDGSGSAQSVSLPALPGTGWITHTHTLFLQIPRDNARARERTHKQTRLAAAAKLEEHEVPKKTVTTVMTMMMKMIILFFLLYSYFFHLGSHYQYLSRGKQSESVLRVKHLQNQRHNIRLAVQLQQKARPRLKDPPTLCTH